MDLKEEHESKIYEELPDEQIVNDFNFDAYADVDAYINNDFSSNSAVYLYLKQISIYPVLTANEEQELFKKMANGDSLAKEKIINSNLRLVVYIVKKYRSENIELLDLIQEGNISLMKAVETFDYTKGFKFSTYAAHLIKNDIIRVLAEKGKTIRVPINAQRMIDKYQSIQSFFYKTHGRYATDAEISEKMQISEYEVKDIKSTIHNMVSLNVSVSDEDDAELGDFIQDTKPTPEDIAIKSSNRKILEELIANSNLKTNEETVIRLRYDFESGEKRTLGYVAKKLNVSREWVRVVENRALKKMRFIAKRKFGMDSFI